MVTGPLPTGRPLGLRSRSRPGPPSKRRLVPWALRIGVGAGCRTGCRRSPSRSRVLGSCRLCLLGGRNGAWTGVPSRVDLEVRTRLFLAVCVPDSTRRVTLGSETAVHEDSFPTRLGLPHHSHENLRPRRSFLQVSARPFQTNFRLGLTRYDSGVGITVSRCSRLRLVRCALHVQ